VELYTCSLKSASVRHCQKTLNVISTRHTAGLYSVPGHAGVRGNEIADKLTEGGSVQKFTETEPSLGGPVGRISKVRLNGGRITSIG
jgi:ribonuclease HI